MASATQYKRGIARVDKVAIFTWKGHPPSDEEVGADSATRYSRDFGEQWEYQECQPVAVAVMEAIRTLGYETDVEAPYFAEHGWHFAVRLGQDNYSIRVQWVARGNKNDAFAVQPSMSKGCLSGFLLSAAPESALRPVREVVHVALSAHPLVAELEWVNEL
jgi:hypothetical protein